jgi:hypothetical protein
MGNKCSSRGWIYDSKLFFDICGEHSVGIEALRLPQPMGLCTVRSILLGCVWPNLDPIRDKKTDGRAHKENKVVSRLGSDWGLMDGLVIAVPMRTAGG